MDIQNHPFFTGKYTGKLIAVFLVIISLFFAVKVLREVKEYHYAGRSAGETNQISVSGEGEAYKAPDIAEITFTIEKEEKTVKAAQTFVDAKSKEVLAFLKKSDILDKDIKFSTGGFYPQYDYPQVQCLVYPCPSSNPVLRGYQVTETFTVKIRKIDDSATIVQGLGSLAVSNLNGPTFMVDDEDGVKAEARTKAINDAEAKAKELARELGVKLVRIVNFSESGNQPYPMMNYARDAKVTGMGMGGAAPEATPLPTGENKYTSNVTITYEIR